MRFNFSTELVQHLASVLNGLPAGTQVAQGVTTRHLLNQLEDEVNQQNAAEAERQSAVPLKAA